MVNPAGYRAETSLFSVDQAFEVFHDAFQDYVNYYLCNDRVPGVLQLPHSKRVPCFEILMIRYISEGSRSAETAGVTIISLVLTD